MRGGLLQLHRKPSGLAVSSCPIDITGVPPSVSGNRQLQQMSVIGPLNPPVWISVFFWQTCRGRKRLLSRWRRSYAMLKPRQKHAHVKRMVRQLEDRYAL